MGCRDQPIRDSYDATDPVPGHIISSQTSYMRCGYRLLAPVSISVYQEVILHLHMLVPLRIAVAVLEVYQELKMLTPGAKRSTATPQLEKLAPLSEMSDAATVIALGAEAGEEVLAFALLFPAATTTVMPAFVAPWTAWLTAWLKPPPSDMLITDLPILEPAFWTAKNLVRLIRHCILPCQG